MKSDRTDKMVFRVVIYLLGITLLSFSVVLSILSNLGINAVNAIPNVLYLRFPSLTIGQWMTVIYIVFILIQVALLGKEFEWIQLTQIAVAFLFGWITDFWKWLLGDIVVTGYFSRMILIIVSTFIRAVAIALYVDTKLVPTPSEGVTQALSKRTGIAFHTMKTIQEVVMIVIAVVLSLAFFRTVVGVREGTVISSVIIGYMMGKVQQYIRPKVEKCCF